MLPRVSIRAQLGMQLIEDLERQKPRNANFLTLQ